MHVHQSVFIWNRDISAQKWTKYSNIPVYSIKCEEILTVLVHIYFTKMTLLHAARYQEVQLTEYADTCICCYQHTADGIRQQYARSVLWKAKISGGGLIPVLFITGTTESSAAVSDV